MSQLKQGGRKKGPILLLLCFCSVQDVNRLDKTHLHWGRHSAEFTDCNAKPIQEHAHRHTQKQRLIWAPCGLSGWPLPSPVITLEQPALLGMRGAESPGRSSQSGVHWETPGAGGGRVHRGRAVSQVARFQGAGASRRRRKGSGKGS